MRTTRQTTTVRRTGRAIVGMLLTAGAVAAGCERGGSVLGPDLAKGLEVDAVQVTGHARSSGGGHYFNPRFGIADTRFAFTAVQTDASGAAKGHFHMTSTDGSSVRIFGRISCMSVDPANPERAWMGGVVTRNDSENPFYTGAASQPGQDVWFRVADYGEGGTASQPDRITMLFRAPVGGFSSAAEFCAGQLWFPGDFLTVPLDNGNIQVVH